MSLFSRFFMSLRAYGLVLTSVSVLVACGGGSDPGTNPPNGGSPTSSSSSSSSSGSVKPSSTIADRAQHILSAHQANGVANRSGALSGIYVHSLSSVLTEFLDTGSGEDETRLFAELASLNASRVDHEADVFDILSELPTTFEIAPIARTVVDITDEKTGFYIVDRSFGAAAGRYNTSRMVDIGHENMVRFSDDSIGVSSALLRGVLRWLTADHAQAYQCRTPDCDQAPIKVAVFETLSVDGGYAVQAVNVSGLERIPADEYPVVVMPNKWPSDQRLAVLMDYVEQGGNVLVMGKVWQNDDINQNAINLMTLFSLRPSKNWDAYQARTYVMDKIGRTINHDNLSVLSDEPSPYPASVVSAVKTQMNQAKQVFSSDGDIQDAVDRVLNVNVEALPDDFLAAQGALSELLSKRIMDTNMPSGLSVSAGDSFALGWDTPVSLEDAALYQYSINAGASWAYAYSNPQPLPRVPFGSGQLHLRQRIAWPQLGIDVKGASVVYEESVLPPETTDFVLQVDDPIRLSGDGNARTVWGRTDGVGVDLVVVAESYIAGDEALFWREAKQAMEFMFGASQPGIALHRNGWNIHFVFAESNERGTDYVKEVCDEATWSDCSEIKIATSAEEARPEYFHDTKFNSGRFCGGRSPNVSRLLCADGAAAKAYAQQYYPQTDQVVVLVNSNAYGGAGGAIAVSSKSSLSVFVHELGHSFAGLADEYGGTDDSQKNRTFPTTLHNVTTVKDPSNVPWKQWLDVTPICGSLNINDSRCLFSESNWRLGGKRAVGYYEGGSYTDEGVWRPTFNSLMRSSGPLFAVNTEIWAHEVYRIRGVFNALYPLPAEFIDESSRDATAELSLARGQAQDFVIALGFGSEVQDVTWTLNGDPLENAKNPLYRMPATQKDDYVLQVSVTDKTNTIRIDPNNQTSKSFTWRVRLTDAVAVNDISVVRKKARSDRATGVSPLSIMVSFEWLIDEEEQHHLVSVKRLDVASAPSHFPYPHLDDLVQYEVRDASGAVLYEGMQGMGRQLRAAGLVDGSFAQHGTQLMDEGEYAIKFPYHDRAHTLAVKKEDTDWRLFDL